MPLSTLRSSERATPRGLFGNSGSMIDRSKSDSSYRRGVIFAPLRELDDVDAPAPADGYDSDRPEADGERLQ
jgi:hypothetical protein